jgi:hypothetical protein
MIFDETLYIHAGFAKPGRPLEEARQAWRDVWDIGFGGKARTA